MEKNKGGRPPKYNTTEEFQKKCDKYFKDCIDKTKIPNKAGLCIALNITRETYNQYKKKDKFSDAIKKAESVIEEAWVQRLNHSAATGAIFYLKNAFRKIYKDRYNTDITSGDKPIAILGNALPDNHSGQQDNKAQEEN